MSLDERLQTYRNSLKRSSGYTTSLKPQMIESLLKDKAAIENFLIERDLPHWYRGTSTFQVKNMENILTALLYDTEMESSCYTRECLAGIGITPMISDKDAKLLIRLSRGNDLAFLWFLNEMFYKTRSPTTYSLSEQLILCSITHLDMITTLRELDRILPPPQPTKKQIERNQKLKEQKKRRQEARKRKANVEKKSTVLPYFDKLTRPNFYGKSSYATVPDFKVNFTDYDRYKDPLYVVPNEDTRWFENYDVKSSKRIARSIINEQLDNMFADYSKATYRADYNDNLCETHMFRKELEASLKKELERIAQQQCLKILEVGESEKEVARKLVKAQLEKDVQRQLAIFRKMSQKQCNISVAKVITGEMKISDRYSDGISKISSESNGCSECAKIISSNGLKEFGACKRKKSMAVDGGGDADCFSFQDTVLPQGILLHHSPDPDYNADMPAAKCAGKSVCNAGAGRRSKAGESIPSSLKSRKSSKPEPATVYFFRSQRQLYDYGHEYKATPTPSQTFFKAPQKHQPYVFDYSKIFKSKDETAPDMELQIKKAFIKALDSEADLIQTSKPPNIAEAVSKCAKKIFKAQVEAQQVKEEQARQLSLVEKSKKPPYYDCDDNKLMTEMLKDALAEMAKNPKFVLASLPEAHKIPTLREWIRKRFGKIYTKHDRFDSFRVSLKIFYALRSLAEDIPYPKTGGLGSRLNMNVSCYKYLMKKAAKIKKDYFDMLDADIMEKSRVFWHAVRPYMCSRGPPRNAYFAYLPARKAEITHYHLWRSHEFADNKAVWDKRRLENPSIIRKNY